MALWVLLISAGGPCMGAIGLLYVIQQWILGWPDRTDLLLDPPSLGRTDRTSLDDLIGKKGVTKGPLRPGGTIVLDGVECSAQSDLGYVDRGVRVIVVGRRGASLVVIPAPIQNDP